MKWVLIFWLTNGFGAADGQIRSHTFETQAACINASGDLKRADKFIRSICVPEGDQRVRESEGRQ